MEKKFFVEAKSFAIVVLDGASVLRVVDKNFTQIKWVLRLSGAFSETGHFSFPSGGASR
jgi:hypothetical protein